MHNKTEKCRPITQLFCHAMHRKRRNVTQQSIQMSTNQLAQIKQVPVTMLQQMLKVTFTHFHRTMQTFAPFTRNLHRMECCSVNPCRVLSNTTDESNNTLKGLSALVSETGDFFPKPAIFSETGDFVSFSGDLLPQTATLSPETGNFVAEPRE